MALEIIKKHTGKLFYADLKELQVTKTLIGNTFIYKGEKYSLGLSGDFQIENA